jgi:hypothetical protein
MSYDNLKKIKAESKNYLFRKFRKNNCNKNWEKDLETLVEDWHGIYLRNKIMHFF